ncbi:MAG TPA: hypothetical protein PK573_05095 [Spirochaetota bacterium]|nr:hypothetical protein [Spirochaetota bacterium]HRZ28795.1 hypothetical protein [Spirochaetota bacterium]
MIKKFSLILTSAAFLLILGLPACDDESSSEDKPEFAGIWEHEVADGVESLESNGKTFTFRSTRPGNAGFYTMEIVNYDEELDQIYAVITEKSFYYTAFTGARWIVYYWADGDDMQEMMWQISTSSFSDAYGQPATGPYVKQ